MGLYGWAGSMGIGLAVLLVEHDSAARLVLRELHDEVRAHDARYVLVPALTHLFTHPLLQSGRVDSIQRRGPVTVLPIDAYTTALCLTFG